jgi:prepilin-type N-terminal cleavage/methylation domain-containing protein
MSPRVIHPRAHSSRPRAFTLVELLVVIAIIGVLVALLLPAIQAARESARRTQCTNQLKQIALACITHENTHKAFPYGGWSFGWMGDPDSGVGPQQPGGWIYSVGPHLEEQVVFNLGAGLPWSKKVQELSKQMAAVVPVFNCPSRRGAKAYPAYGPGGAPCERAPKNADLPPEIAKSDYAINGGIGDGWNDGAGGSGGSPEASCLFSAGFGDTSYPGTYPDCNWHITDRPTYNRRFNGVSGWRTAARIAQIIDGTSHTLLVAEKLMQPKFYEHSCPNSTAKGNGGDNSSMYQGWDIDTSRTGGVERDYDAKGATGSTPNIFGGPHATLIAAYCDGSVHALDYDTANFNDLVRRNDADELP